MGRKKILEKRLDRLQKKKNRLTQRALESQDVNEVRSINEQLSELNEEIEETQDEIDSLEDEPLQQGTDPGTDPGTNLVTEPNQRRNNVPSGAQIVNPPIHGVTHGLGTFEQRGTFSQEGQNIDPYATMEYRTAFMQYAQRGIPMPANLVQRAAGDPGPTVTTDIGVIIPTTIMSEFINQVAKVYGHIYNKVRKLNIQGGVKFPISNLKAEFKWIGESETSDRQKAGDVKEYVEFSYNIGEVRVSQTLLSQVVALPVFESEITRIMVEGYVEAMDKGIISGTGTGQMLGITKDPRVTNIVEFTEAEFSSWVAWRKKLFAKIPLTKRGRGEFLFPASTIEGYLMTMQDKNERPLWKDPDNGMSENGALAGKFFGRETDYVEPDVIVDFATAAAGDIVGIFWVPTDYAINTNLQFGMQRYFDQETNQWVNKGLTIVDGKILDPSGCYLIKKKA